MPNLRESVETNESRKPISIHIVKSGLSYRMRHASHRSSQERGAGTSSPATRDALIIGAIHSKPSPVARTFRDRLCELGWRRLEGLRRGRHRTDLKYLSSRDIRIAEQCGDCGQRVKAARLTRSVRVVACASGVERVKKASRFPNPRSDRCARNSKFTLCRSMMFC